MESVVQLRNSGRRFLIYNRLLLDNNYKNFVIIFVSSGYLN